MDRSTYEIEAQVEREHWWFRGRRKILRDLVQGLDARRVLDVGCGTGANGPVLCEGGRFVVGVEPSEVPLGLAGTGERGHEVRLRGDGRALPFADGSFDLVVALDVLEHIDDDAAAVRELRRVSRPGGALIIFVPALQILWGLQDDVSHHRRRYAAGGLRRVIEGAGYRIDRLSYFNTLLFPPILAARLAMRVRRPKDLKSENQVGGRVTNSLLGAIFGLESPILRRINLPIGVSLLCVATRV